MDGNRDFVDEGVETDGRSLYQSKDPPGQRCVYILPGNTNSEVYRLSTFSRFPNHVPVDPVLLARNGFFYTGYKDRVKCFSCANCVEDWTASDDVTSRDWHDERCAFLNRTDHGNIPIRIFRNPPSVTNMQTTSQYTPPLPEPHEDNNPPLQNTVTVQTARAASNNNESELLHLFPCLTPRNPHMRNTTDRLQTFLDSRDWPRERFRAMPQQFAEAGLFYLGSRDRVKCWYCNGGLQNWEETDEPWFEHAKWFPKCDFLLQSKGPSFVALVTEQFPNLARPSQSVPAFMNYNPTANRETNENVNIIDPREDSIELERKIDNDMMTSLLVEEARVMGFTDLHIREALRKGYETSTVPFENFRCLVDALLSISMSEPSTPDDEMNSAETKPHEPPLSRAFQELRDLEKSRLCKTCRYEPSSVLLLPCGHLVCCEKCSEDVKKCPLCRRGVNEKVRSYIV